MNWNILLNGQNVMKGEFAHVVLFWLKYQDEQGHKKFISESEHLWGKVIVYDSVNRW